MARAALILACALAAGCATPVVAPAAPVAEVAQNGVAVRLFREPCTLAGAVSNLPYRATWEQGGRTFEGCYTVQHGTVVVAYFDDRSVVAIPLSLFRAAGAPPPSGRDPSL